VAPHLVQCKSCNGIERTRKSPFMQYRRSQIVYTVAVSARETDTVAKSFLDIATCC
jgi:hypothetical protein